MTASSSPEPTDIVCTLTTKDRSARVLEWTDLAGLATSSAVLPNGVASTFATELAPMLEDLAQRERDCCGSWLEIDLGLVDEGLELRLTTDSVDGLAMIRSLAGLAA